MFAGPNAAHAASSPIAAFSWTPCESCAVVGFLFFFSAGASLATSGSIVLYTWNFGDGSPLVQTTNPSTSHDYPSSCSPPCLVTLTVQDSNKQTDTISHEIMFDTVPVIGFQPVNASAGLPVTFNGTGSIAYNSANPILGYEWSFGDGTNATGKIVQHVYALAGPYRIILTLVTAEGDPSASTTIQVRPTILVETTFDAVNVNASGVLSINSTAKTLTGSVLVTAANATTGALIFSKTFTISLSYGTSSSVRLVLVISGNSLALGVSCSISTSSTTAATCYVSKDPDINRNGSVDAFDLSSLLASFGTVQGSSGYNPAADLNANGKIDVFDLSILLADYGAAVFQ